MKRNIIQYIMGSLTIALIISGCTPVANKEMEEELEAKNEVITLLEQEKSVLEERVAELEAQLSENPATENDSLLYTSLEVIQLIKEKDMVELSSYVHPTKGLRFTAYAYIDEDDDQVFNADKVATLLNDSQIFTWGSYDGTGDPIDLSFGDYYDKFIYDADFASPHIIGNNVIVGKGNSLNNITEIYPDGIFIEFHFTGFDPQFEGMDWESLRLVFEEEEEGSWYLVGIVHDQWTI